MLWIAIGALVLGVFYFIGIYNGLVRARNESRNGWSQIDVQLKRRHDLIPNLVETAKGYMKHERETLEAVIKARNTAVAALDAAKAEVLQKLDEVPGYPDAVLKPVVEDIDPESVDFCHRAKMDYVSCSPYRVPIARLAAAHAAIKARRKR